MRPISHKDAERLAPHMSNWNRLTDICASGVLTPEDVHLMIRHEATTLKRPPILRRLVGYLKSRERDALLKELGL